MKSAAGNGRTWLTEEDPKCIEEEEEVAAAIVGERQVQSVDEGEEPELAQTGVMWWCQCLSAIESESKFLCESKFLSRSKFQQCQFLLEEMAESAEERAICLTSYPSFALHQDREVLDV